MKSRYNGGKMLVIDFQEPNDINLVREDIICIINKKAFGRYDITK